MTKRDAIFFLNGLRIANNCDETIDMAIAALNEPVSPTTQLDENGLMPCGCGGTAVRNGILFIDGYAYVTSCIECVAMAWSKKTQEEADERWNTAMGWREDK